MVVTFGIETLGLNGYEDKIILIGLKKRRQSTSMENMGN